MYSIGMFALWKIGWHCSSKDLLECKTKVTKRAKHSSDTASKNVYRRGVARETEIMGDFSFVYVPRPGHEATVTCIK